jgi:LacI family transcriptional regulator, galactose operon repressor
MARNADGPARRDVRLKDVANVAGVHPATVSRALDPGKMWLVRPETRARVQSVARDLGYRGDAVARSLRRGQTTTVGVIVADLSLTFLAPVVRGLTDALERRGFMAVISETQDDHERLRASVENLLSRRVDGIVVTAARLGDGAVLEEVAAERPVVLAVRTLAGTTIPSVTSDDVAGGYLAAKHLAELGHQRIAQLHGPPDVQPFVDRRRGFMHGVEDFGLELVPMDETAIHPTPSEGQRLMRMLLGGGQPRPTAVFAHNDSMAIGALAAIRAGGLACPADVSLIGYNDAPLVEHLDPPLSTIAFHGESIGRFAGELVIALIEESSSHVASMTFPPELVARASTAPPGGAGRRRRNTSKGGRNG